MKREFIKSLLPEIDKNALDAIMAENDKDIKDQKNTISTLTTERNGLKTQLAGASRHRRHRQESIISALRSTQRTAAPVATATPAAPSPSDNP